MSGVYQELGDRSGPGIMPHAAAISCCSKGSAWEAWLGTVLALFFFKDSVGNGDTPKQSWQLNIFL